MNNRGYAKAPSANEKAFSFKLSIYEISNYVESQFVWDPQKESWNSQHSYVIFMR